MPPETSRRNLLAGAIAAASLAPTLAHGQDPKFVRAGPGTPGAALKVERFPIWPGTPQGYPVAGVKDVFVKRNPTGDEDDMPPTYVACNADDPVVPPENAILIFRALNALKVPSELMIFEKGGHGPPAPHKNGTPTPWMELFQAFAGDHGWPVRT